MDNRLPSALPDARPEPDGHRAQAPVAAEEMGQAGPYERLLRPPGVTEAEPAAAPPKRPVRVGERLRYGMDIDGTITQAPRHFKSLMDALLAAGDYVCIVTGRLEHRRRETEAFLASMGIQYDELIMCPNSWLWTVADFKVEVVRQKQLHLIIDDDPRNCWAVTQRTEALAAHMLPIPEMPEPPPEQPRPLRPRGRLRGLVYEVAGRVRRFIRRA